MSRHDGQEREQRVKKEVWFGLSIMALMVIGVFWMHAAAVADDQRPPRAC